MTGLRLKHCLQQRTTRFLDVIRLQPYRFLLAYLIQSCSTLIAAQSAVNICLRLMVKTKPFCMMGQYGLRWLQHKRQLSFRQLRT